MKMKDIFFGMPEIGERVFNTDSLTGKIYSLKIKEISADVSSAGVILIIKAKGWRKSAEFNMEELGKSFFLSKAEARCCHV